MIKVVSVQKEDGKKVPSTLDLRTGVVKASEEVSGSIEVEVKGSRYETVNTNGVYSVSMDDLKEIIFETQS